MKHSWKQTRKFASQQTFMVGHRRVPISRETRRFLRQCYREYMRRQRAKKKLGRLKHHEWHNEVNLSRKTLRLARANRGPVRRVRSRDKWVSEKAPTVTYTLNGYVKPVSHGYFPWGDKGNVTDFCPIARLDPPRNISNFQRLRSNSLRTSFTLNQGGNKVSFPMGKWGLCGLTADTYPNLLPYPIPWVQEHAEKALLKVQAEIYEADIQMNEYLFEWRQVLRLLMDPKRTLLKATKLLKKWVGGDQWMYIPGQTLRRFGQGVLVSKAPTGAVLMSLRTRRKISNLSPSKVSASMLREASNRWLQYRYGIMPLVGDAMQIVQMADKPFFPHLLSKSARNVLKKVKIPSSTTYTWTPLVFRFHKEYSEGAAYSAKQWYRFVKKPSFPYRLGLDSTQWARALWNAIPGSFVLDWVVDVDQWLQAVANPPHIKLLGNCVTATDYVRTEVKLVGAYLFNMTSYPAKQSGYCYAFKTLERMHRRIDFPRVDTFSLSEKFQKFKNLMTMEALLLQSVLTRTKPKR